MSSLARVPVAVSIAFSLAVLAAAPASAQKSS
jgi:hypothetical protein